MGFGRQDGQANVSKYATGSEVPANRSRGEMEQVLKTHGARGFGYGWTQEFDRVEFLWHDRQIRFVLPRPKLDAFGRTPKGRARTERDRQLAFEAEDRRRWRALLLVIRAKLEAVETGIAVFEEEFLAHIVMPNDQTIGEILLPRLEDGSLAKRLLPPAQHAK